MKKKCRGSTLVEVLVAMTVFLIISGAIFTSVMGIRKIVVRQEEALRVSYLFSDIEVFYDNDSEQKTSWLTDYATYMGAILIENADGSYSFCLDDELKYAEAGIYTIRFDIDAVTLIRDGVQIGERKLGGQNES